MNGVELKMRADQGAHLWTVRSVRYAFYFGGSACIVDLEVSQQHVPNSWGNAEGKRFNYEMWWYSWGPSMEIICALA